MLLPGPDLHRVGPLALWDFPNISAKYRLRPKKVLPFERGAPGTGPDVKSVPGYCITFIKRLDESLS